LAGHGRAALVLALALGGSAACLAESRVAGPPAPGIEERNAPAAASLTERWVAGFQTGVTNGDGVRAVFRSYETAAIGAELNARITYLPRREGDRIRKGDLIVEFDCRKIAAEHEAAQAAHKASRAAYEAQLEMKRYHAAGTLSVDQSRFEMEKAEAEAKGLEAKRTDCRILAPFDGRVVEKMAQVHEIAQPNQPLLRIINDSRLELVLMVPSSWLPAIPDGTRFSVRIDESGEMHQARVVQSTGLIDPVSQSARLIAELVEPAASVQAGMSGTAVFAQRAEANE
jgi:RND family efflux transporter MFP subunit